MKPKPKTIILTITSIAVLAFAFDYTRKSGSKQASEASSYYLKSLSNDVMLAEWCKRLDERIDRVNTLFAERTHSENGLRDRITALENRPAQVIQQTPVFPWAEHPMPKGGWTVPLVTAYITNSVQVAVDPAEQAEIERMQKEWEGK